MIHAVGPDSHNERGPDPAGDKTFTRIAAVCLAATLGLGVAAGGAQAAPSTSRPTSAPTLATAATAKTTTSTVVGDFDGDGKADIVFNRAYRSSADPGGPRYAPSAGGAQVPLATRIAQWTKILTPGDVNGDGKQDLMGVTATGAVELLVDPTDTNFPALQRLATGWAGYNRVSLAGDLSGDGKPDILARDTQGRLYMFTLDGTTIGPRVDLGWGFEIYDQLVAAGDLSGDGKADILARQPNGDLYLYAGGARVFIGWGWQGYNQFIAGGDYNGDGLADLYGRMPSGDLVLYSGMPGGQLSPGFVQGSGWEVVQTAAGLGGGFVPGKNGVAVTAATSPRGGIALGDGKGGLVLPEGGADWRGSAIEKITYGPFAPSRYVVQSSSGLLHSKGSSHDLQISFSYSWGGTDTTVLPGDLDGDGRGDLLARRNGSLYFHKGPDEYPPQPVPADFPYDNLVGPAVDAGSGWNVYNQIVGGGDLTGDGLADLVAREHNGDLYLYQGNGSGLSPRVKIGAGWDGYDKIAVTGDINGDGIADIIGRDATGRIWLHAGRAGGQPLAPVVIANAWGRWSDIS
ncbi:VCBS repeat-containing protein [Streptomyces sp. SID3343]|uniref:FG-GAP repeat domain-containing protein n=1 Tax=Streptomyces sp. SID3343 TaxID=2690260 RepID=UPI001371F4D1|nr:VCBS repeat-containing protein [Streptomyces sp. SID3343]MYW02148.1 hypothetical protein [Streptomyces sp. SID3343]